MTDWMPTAAAWFAGIAAVYVLTRAVDVVKGLFNHARKGL